MSRGLSEVGLATARATLGPLFLRRWDIQLHDEQHVPGQGRVIIAANHLGWADGPALVGRSPRPLHMMVKEEEFAGGHRHLLRALAQIKVARNRVDSGAIRRAVRALEADQAVGIFPEGLRGDGELSTIKSGVAYLALATGAPIVPLAIFGTRERDEDSSSRPAAGARIDLVFGAPIQLDAAPWPRTPDRLGAATDTIHAHLTDHLARAKTAVGRELPGPLPAGAWDV
ncbi:lysophospholipid acyltransferase family protein [Aeromicrobium sp. CF3.5]|uniref:lysophospholipid acyltransferase family protein n=1 Tax=Aeromicrobium sp. CF3.5 TaxID=3373078 RepID=UPI003EE4C5A8